MDSAAAETHVRLLAEAQLRRAASTPRYLWLDEDFKLGGTPPEEEGLLRVKAVLNALHRVGAIGDATAWSVLSEFEAALVPPRLVGRIGICAFRLGSQAREGGFRRARGPGCGPGGRSATTPCRA